jgi:amidase
MTTIGIQLASVNGPLARRVADLRAAFELIAGPTWRDPWTVPAPLHGPALEKPIRVAVVVDPAGGGTAHQVRDGVHAAGRALGQAGYVIEEREPPGITAAANALLVMLSTPGMRTLWDDMVSASMPEATRRFMRAFFEAAGNPDAVMTEQSFITRSTLLRQWGEFQETHPLILAPIATEVPTVAGTDLAEGGVARDIHTMRMAMAVNTLGLPAVAVPVGVGDGLPQVVQVIGPRYREDLCLDAAEAIESRLGIITPIDPQRPGGAEK